MASDDIMTAGAGGATATVRADIKAAFFDIVNGKAPEYEHWLSFI